MSAKDAKAEAENAAQLSVFLVENAIVVLMLIEDHFRLQSKISNASRKVDGNASPVHIASSLNNHSNSTVSISRESFEAEDDDISVDSGGLPFDVCILYSQRHIFIAYLKLYIIY